VYEIRNNQTNAVYIGSSTHTHFRWDRHYRELTRGVHVNPKLQAAWNKYGADKFEFKMLETHENPTEKFLREREKAVILQTGVLITGYNLSADTVAPMAGRKHSDVSRAKMSASQTGRKHTEETKKKIGEANSRRVWTPEMRAKRAEIARKNQIGKTYVMSKQGRKNISEAKRGKPTGPWAQPMSLEGRKNISRAHLGIKRKAPVTAKERENRRQAALLRWATIREAHHTT